jgi:hypothetical protein
MVERWQERARGEAAKIEGRAVVERWNAAFGAGKGTLVPDDPGGGARRHAVARRALSRLPD